MSARTPGRLLAGVCIYEDGSKHFCAVQEGNEKKVVALTGLAGEANEQEAMSNAHRLAVCWNACEGVPTEVLEAQQSGGLPWSVADQIEQRVQFNAYKEGSEEAFGAVVEQKRKAEERASCIERTIQVQQCVIVNMRAQRDALLAALRRMENHPASRSDELPEMARSAIANVEGSAT